ncbi:MAG TPA: metallophosphoesterase [Thermoanaerobaculia bacterium]
MAVATARFSRRRRGQWISFLAISATGFLCLGAFGCASSSAAYRRSLVVGIVGDQTLSPDLQASYQVLQQGVSVLSDLDLDVVLHVGDLVESGLSPEEVRASFAQATGILDQLPADWFLTAGDHDVSPPGYSPNSSDRSREKLFQELYGERVPAFRQRPYYSFDVKGVHFVALYSHQALQVDPRWGDIFLARIADDQLAWLREDLAAHRRTRAIVVFLHQPLWYHWSGWRRVHALLRQYPVAAVVAGHFHYDQDEGELDGIRYLVVGATGGSIKEGSQDAGNLHHVTLLRVAGPRQVEVELLPVHGEGPVGLTPREDMDRVQALDVQLGNFFDFSLRERLFLKDGRLVDTCEGAQPPKVQISQIGNPIDLPLEVTIDFRSEPPGVALDSPHFLPGNCREARSGTECLLAPAARTDFSNYSSVQIQGVCPCAPGPSCFNPDPCTCPLPPPPCPCALAPPLAALLWESGLVAAAGPPPSGTVLSFRVRTRFAGASGPLFLDKSIQTRVCACPAEVP